MSDNGDHSNERSISEIDTKILSQSPSSENSNTSLTKEEEEHIYENVITMPSRSQRKRNNKRKNKQQRSVCQQTLPLQDQILENNQSPNNQCNQHSTSNISLPDALKLSIDASSSKAFTVNETEINKTSHTTETKFVTNRKCDIQRTDASEYNSEHSQKYNAKMSLLNSPHPIKHIQKPPTPPIRQTRKLQLKKAQRAALQQYFSPMLSSPRYLDSISEEKTDISGEGSGASTSKEVESSQRVTASTSNPITGNSVELIPTEIDQGGKISGNMSKIQKNVVNSNVRMIPIEICGDKEISKIKSDVESDNVRIIPVEISSGSNSQIKKGNIQSEKQSIKKEHMRIIPIEINNNSREVDKEDISHNLHTLRTEVAETKSENSHRDDKSYQKGVRIIPIELKTESSQESDFKEYTTNRIEQETSSPNVRVVPIEINDENKKEFSTFLNANNDLQTERKRYISTKLSEHNEKEAAKDYSISDRRFESGDISKEITCTANKGTEAKIKLIPIDVNKSDNIVNNNKLEIPASVQEISEKNVRVIPIKVDTRNSEDKKNLSHRSHQMNNLSEIFSKFEGASEKQNISEENTYENVRVIPGESWKMSGKETQKTSIATESDQEIPITVQQMNEPNVRVIPINIDTDEKDPLDKTEKSKNDSSADFSKNIYENIRLSQTESEISENQVERTNLTETKHEENINASIYEIPTTERPKGNDTNVQTSHVSDNFNTPSDDAYTVTVNRNENCKSKVMNNDNLNEPENLRASKSRSPSEVSEDNSSRGSSLCTAINTGKYNPHSSVGNVESISIDEETNCVTRDLFNPKTLREICLEFLKSIPFGKDMLQELADVAESIKSITDELSHEILPQKRAQNLMHATESQQTSMNVTSSNETESKEDMRPKVPERKAKKIIIKTEDPKEHIQRGKESPIHTLLGILKDESKHISCSQGNIFEDMPYRHYHEQKTVTLPRKMRLYKDGRMENEYDNLRSMSEQNLHHIRAPTTLPRNLQPIKEDKILSRQPFSWENKVNKKYVSEANLAHSNQTSTLPRDVRLYKDGRMFGNNSYAWKAPYEKTQSEFNLTNYGNYCQPRLNYESDTNYDSEPCYVPRRAKCPMQKPLTRTLSYDSEPNYDSEPYYVPRRPKTPSEFDTDSPYRRFSLPQEIYQEQLVSILEKEHQIQRELEHLEDEKRKLYSELSQTRKFKSESCLDSPEDKLKATSNVLPSLDSERFRNKMYEEYLNQMAAREERLKNKILKVSSKPSTHVSESASQNQTFEVVHVSGIEEEFMKKVKEKQNVGKLFKKDDSVTRESDKENEEDASVLVMDGNSLEKVKRLPKHLKEFANLTKYVTENGVWSPGQSQENLTYSSPQSDSKDEPIAPVWTPQSSPVLERKQFKPVNFELAKLKSSQINKDKNSASSENLSTQSSWNPQSNTQKSFSLEKLGPPVPRLPKIQSPTVTLLQKAREGQLKRLSRSVETVNKDSKQVNIPSVQRDTHRYEPSQPEAEKRKTNGIGPTTKDGMPIILRSEVRDADQSKWYKKMYDTIHKPRKHNDEYVTVRYKQRRVQYPYTSGYLSEPGSLNYDSDFGDKKFSTFDRMSTSSLRDQPDNNRMSSTVPRNLSNKSWSSNDNIESTFDTQPRSIETYHPGRSSITGKEAKKWWDEVMDIFDGQFEEEEKKFHQSRANAKPSLKESGYESDSLLVFKRKENNNNIHQIDPVEQREVYKSIQKGGDVPLHGLRKPAPEKPKESQRKYIENDVTIHYKTPVIQEIKEYVSEGELAQRQADSMKKTYEDERRRKYLQVSNSLQELQDINSRRHSDNFIPSQKSPIPLDRYDNIEGFPSEREQRRKSPEPRLVARALFNFVGQTPRELTFRKGDLIYVRRQIDKNWYEGELNAMIGLFPANYVEIKPYEEAKTTPRKSYEGQARAKYNFVAQTHLELSLAKGELVVITRRVDENWFEGKIGGKKGIFPVSYVEVLIDPSETSHHNNVSFSSPALQLSEPVQRRPHLDQSSMARPAKGTENGIHGSVHRNNEKNYSQQLHIETQSEPTPYRALFRYLPQNDDELELMEGDTVYVLEKCDDGWYVGSSERTGAFGTFPGNYVEKM